MNDWAIIDDNPYYRVNRDGDIYSTITERKLTPIRQKTGYVHVTLCDEDGNHRQRSVHRIVASAFIPNPDKLPIINHKDGCKTNNCVDNLEWCTHSRNSKHAYEIGLQKPIPSQIEDSLSKAIEKRKRPVRNIMTGECYESVEECSKKEGITHSAVSQHATGKIKKRRFEYV